MMKSKHSRFWVLVLVVIGIVFSGCVQQPSEKSESNQSQIPTSNPLQSETSPYTIAFTVKVPENTPNHTVVYLQIIEGTDEWVRHLKMERIRENLWHFAANLKDFKGKEITYRYMRNGWGFPGAEEFSPDSKIASRKVLVAEKSKEVNDTVEKWRWLPKGEYAIPTIPTSAGKIAFKPRVGGEKFQKGVVFADFWWDNFAYLLDSTNLRLKENNFEWVQISLDWNCQSGFGGYSDETFNLHLKKTKDYGFKVYLNTWFSCPVSEDSLTNEWWDVWFEQYENYVMYFVDKANKNNVDQLIIGGDDFAVDRKPSNYKQKLESIYSKARQQYNGKLGRAFSLGNDAVFPLIGPDIPYLEQWDFYAVKMWVAITDKNNSTQEELNVNVNQIFNSVLKPIYQKYHKPIVLYQVAYQSIDGGLTGKSADDPDTAMWEPYSDKYALDLEEQAMAFEAVMKNVAENTDYIIGIYPFAYWPDEFPLSKEYNVRGKPAEEVLNQWYKSIS